FLSILHRPPTSTLFPYTTLFRSFRNPSVYCADLLELITYVRDRVIADVRRLKALYIRLDLCGQPGPIRCGARLGMLQGQRLLVRSEEHTSELQSLAYLVCRLLLE